MQRTFFFQAEARIAAAQGDIQLAGGYHWNRNQAQFETDDPVDMPEASGAGAIMSSVNEYARWLQVISQSPPLSKSAHTALLQPRSIITNSSPKIAFRGTSLYSLGWFISTYRGEMVIWYTGSLPGFSTFVCFIPNREWGVVIMGNTLVTSAYA